ncbi:class I SAM-dependent methyltransferase [Haloprofundus salinisoli]|uniref:class I SAM-dependent methyltransferase n=1 Tax=Haloprofundus salinisoli TaxID=2876193 RepID=UPI001CCB2036|nr:class I SAM-dependent methyltransferase [Haloprofundus salinisoli]
MKTGDRTHKKATEMKDDTQSADYGSITEGQRETWSSGDFNEIARQNVVMAEALCEAVDPHPGQRVLDVACGSGTAALVAERRYCDVTGLDYVPGLIERAKTRAQANGQEIDFQIGDAQAMPFPDNSFDAVLSVYGIQFAPNQEQAARELLRVCKPGGKIGLAGPIPGGWSGDWFAAHARYVPPPPNVPSPLRWGTNDGLDELLSARTRSIESNRRTVLQYYRSIDHAVDVFSTYFGPTVQALKMLDSDAQERLRTDLGEVFDRYNRATDGTAIVENQYLQTVVIPV